MLKFFASPPYLISFFIFVGATLLNIVAYFSFDVALVGCLGLAAGYVLLCLCLCSVDERRAFVLMYAICWLWAAVAAFYANYFNDVMQSSSDAGRFFFYASSNAFDGYSVAEIAIFTEGAGAVIIWRYVYKMLIAWGVDNAAYIGITFNTLLTSLTLIIGFKTLRHMLGDDWHRKAILVLQFTACGILWLFATLHVRDVFPLISISLLVWLWVRFLENLHISRLFLLIIGTILGFPVLALLRAEFYFVPVALLLAGFVAIVFGRREGIKKRKLIILLSALFILPAAIGVFTVMFSDMLMTVVAGNQAYSQFALGQSEGGSLGNRLIVSQPLPIRAIVGAIYLLIFPIPVWSGFFEGTAYHMLKSFHAIFMYFVTPLFILGLWQVARRPMLRTPQVLFISIVALGFLIVVAVSSLETRHLGVFMLPIFLVALIPDLSTPQDQDSYGKLLRLNLGVMVGIHLAWAVVKLV